MRRRTTVSSALVAAALVALTGCGQQQSAGPATPSGASAPASSPAASSPAASGTTSGATPSTTPSTTPSGGETSASPSSTSPGTPQGTPPGGGVVGGVTRVVQVPTGASFGFAVPSGRTVCVVTNGEGMSVSCTFAPAGFAPMAPRSDCPGESRTVLGLTAGRAAQGCVVEPLVEQALLGTPHTAWWQNGRDAYLPTQPPMPKGRLAVLGHGSSMAVGTTRCTVTDTGVECRDSGTGQGFDVTRNGYRFVR